MLLIKTNSNRAECLLGAYGLTQISCILLTSDQKELLGQDVTHTSKEDLPKIKASVKLWRTMHTLIGLLDCTTKKPLESGKRDGPFKLKDLNECTQQPVGVGVQQHLEVDTVCEKGPAINKIELDKAEE